MKIKNYNTLANIVILVKLQNRVSNFFLFFKSFVFLFFSSYLKNYFFLNYLNYYFYNSFFKLKFFENLKKNLGFFKNFLKLKKLKSYKRYKKRLKRFKKSKISIIKCLRNLNKFKVLRNFRFFKKIIFLKKFINFRILSELTNYKTTLRFTNLKIFKKSLKWKNYRYLYSYKYSYTLNSLLHLTTFFSNFFYTNNLKSRYLFSNYNFSNVLFYLNTIDTFGSSFFFEHRFYKFFANINNFFFKKFFEIIYNKKCFLRFNNYGLKFYKRNKSYLYFYRKFRKIKSFSKNAAFLSEIMRILVILMYSKDIYLFKNWFKKICELMYFKLHRKFFYFLKLIIFKCFLCYARRFRCLGFYLRIKGKISLGGGAKKKRNLIKLGRFSFTTKRIKMAYDRSVIRTVSGILGFEILLSYV